MRSLAAIGILAACGGTTEPGPEPEPGAKPGAANTGAPDALAAYTGPCDISEAGTVIDGADITCSLLITADDVTIRRSRMRAGVTIRLAANVTIEDSTSEAGASISSATRVTLRRNDLHGPGDGLHITSDSGAMCETIVLEANWVHGPQIGPGDHYDVMQVRGVRGLVARGNTLDAGPFVEVQDGGTNAVVFFEDANGGNSDVELDANWLNGGGYMLYSAATNARYTDNQIGRDHEYGLLYTSFVPFAESGNVYEDDGSPVQLQP